MAEKEVFDFNQMKIPNVSPNLIKYGVIGIHINTIQPVLYVYKLW